MIGLQANDISRYEGENIATFTFVVDMNRPPLRDE